MTSPRADVRDFDKIPDELKQLPQWECWRYIDGRRTAIDTHSGRPAYGPGFSVIFAEAIAYFVAHEDVEGIFLRIKESDDANAIVRRASTCGCQVVYDKPRSAIKTGAR
jgi:hypothetical protein